MAIYPILHLTNEEKVLPLNIDFIKIVVKPKSKLICTKNMCKSLPKIDAEIYAISDTELPHTIEYGKNEVKFIPDIFSVPLPFECEDYYILADDIPRVFTDISHIEKVYARICYPDEGDTFFSKPFKSFKEYEYPVFKNYTIDSILHNSKNRTCKSLLLKRGNGESQYLDILESVLENGQTLKTRNADTLSEFSKTLTFDLKDGFPLLSTKKMFFRGIVEEFLFFINGQTDSKILEEKNINIWKPNTTREFLRKRGLNYREGLMGPMYGYLWRYYGAEYLPNGNPNLDSKYTDQLKYVVDTIINDPQSRRILLTSYDPLSAEKSVLFPCHSVIVQFYVRHNLYLDMYVYIRSSDLFLGLPFNIASSALFLFCISRITKKMPGRLIIQLGDAHIYTDHISAVEEQLSRRLHYKFPKLQLEKVIESIEDLEKLTFEDFKIVEYQHYPAIKAKMIA